MNIKFRNNLLRLKQGLSLEYKILMTRDRIRRAVDLHGESYLYISFSGGKDSTVLKHICEGMGYNIECVFVNTGLEYPSLVGFALDQRNVTMFRPKTSFSKFIKEQGYPVVSKKISRMLHDQQNPTERNYRTRELNNTKDFIGSNGKVYRNSFYLSDKHRYLIEAPFKITHKCCNAFKKAPFKDYEKLNPNKVAMMGTMAEESSDRKNSYIKNGCVPSEGKIQPLAFWTEQDILEYIVLYNVKIAPPYGDVVLNTSTNLYETTQEKRTGCVFCLYGIENDGEVNRLQRLRKNDPKLHDYVLNNLGFKEVCDFMKIKY